ncbi:MAG: hypothetical protein CO017_01855 [Zetaproteobacteria bacterium CG_4_8_14_3_um_filter_59_5]|nr:MAG: hypothetical protein COX56_05185 [Zetaproteobacteria bacterium CG23_combo_of_CG06-09_8_20_14_all_59_86]PIU96027.1 MAG: hypothetical protein COS62_11250 [Zetaproteobacteria bacterium CG03_land_8_20_14_0_80_59_51]PJC71090.1 MAG: hypothetical protein CO017_01855 [Zetaproteobacteria bacterium CG_4_8_14_3_um_filter_59_5]
MLRASNHRLLAELDMGVCLYCGQETVDAKKACQPCRESLAAKIWKRQMRTYGIFIALGMLMLVYAYFQFTSHHYNIGDAPLLLKLATVLGGLGLMGGLFGLALAVFFNIWHGRSAAAK